MENIPTPNSEDLVIPPNPMAKLSEMPDFKERLEQLREQEKKRGAKILAAVDKQRLDDIGEDIGREEVVVTSSNPADEDDIWINMDEGGSWKLKTGEETPTPPSPTPETPPPSPTPETPTPTPDWGKEGNPHDPSDLVDSNSGIGQEEAERFTAAEAEAAAAAQAAAHEESERQRQAEQEEMPEIQDSHYNEEAEEFFAKLGLDVARPQSQPSKKKHNHEHIPSHHPEFLKNQAIAREKGQRMVGNEKRPYIFSHEISERVKNGEDIHELVKNANAESVWHHIDEFAKNGANIEEIFDNMPKSTRWLSIDELVQNGYDVDKLADKLNDTEVWLQADKLVKNGANVNRLKQRLSKDAFLRSLIYRGELLV